MDLYYSFIIPVFNRPNEIQELFESLVKMRFDRPYEVVIVEDGSSVPCDEVVSSFNSLLDITYIQKKNSGPGDSRNVGMSRAKGNYFIILDSDCIIPEHYLETVDSYLSNSYCDCFGGADAAHSSFSTLQKAINYVMTSFLTTGGIRGRKKAIQKFEPRSFNMGISSKAFLASNGFSDIHPGEDPDLSQRLVKLGFETNFIPDAYVFHKRRISWSKFYLQVKKFGLVRPILNSWHPEAAKITYWLPTVFVFFVLVSLLSALFINLWCILPLGLYLIIIFLHASVLNNSLIIGFYALVALFIQFFGYGMAFLKSTFYINWLNKNPREKFPALFFK